VQEANPTTNYGTSTQLRTDGASDPDVESYVRFTLAGLGGAPTSAKLRLYVTNGSVNGPAAYGTSNDWTETGITWANRPARTTGELDDEAAVATNAWMELDVSGFVTGDGTYSFALATTSGDGVDMHSREGSLRPELVVTAPSEAPPPPGDTTPPSVPTNLAAAATSATSVELSWTASTDDVGVAGYDVYRNGSLLVTVGAVTSYVDTTAAPSTTYQYALRARDAAGNVSTLSDPASATTPAPPPPTTFTFAPDADARVQEANPTSNYGTSTTLRTDAGSDPDVESYLRFSLSGLGGPPTNVKLRLYVTNGSTNGPAVYSTGTAWSETGITWANRPARTSGPTDDKGTVAGNAWVEFDVTTLVTGNGTYSFALANSSSDAVDMHSREGSLRPELVVTT
jgi:hypothetical protein